MLKIHAAVLLSSLASLPAIIAVPIWGQCGGLTYTGSKTCDAGLTCVYMNDYYSQCLASTTSSTTSKTSSSSTTTTSSSSTSSSTPPVTGVKYWFSFGDSYTQTGFDITGAKPSSSNPFGNPTYPGYTACGSYPNWIDYDVTAYQGNTQLEAFNFAVGGATINSTLVAPYQPGIPALTDQTATFLSSAGTKPSYAPWTSANALFSFWFGINDIGNSYYQSGDRSAFSDVLLNDYFTSVAKIYAQGGRNFLFLTVPGVDRSPLMLAQSSSAQALEKSVIDTFNTKLRAKAAAFQAANPGTSTYIYDTNAKLITILNNPTAYGFVDATSYGDVVKNAWCNNYHISPPVHNLLAQEIAPILKSAGFFV